MSQTAHSVSVYVKDEVGRVWHHVTGPAGDDWEMRVAARQWLAYVRRPAYKKDKPCGRCKIISDFHFD